MLPDFTGLQLVDLWMMLKPVHVFSLFPPAPSPYIPAALQPKHNMSQQTWNQNRGERLSQLCHRGLSHSTAQERDSVGMGGACAWHTLPGCKRNHGTDILSGIEERNCCQGGSRGDLMCGAIKHILLKTLRFQLIYLIVFPTYWAVNAHSDLLTIKKSDDPLHIATYLQTQRI